MARHPFNADEGVTVNEELGQVGKQVSIFMRRVKRTESQNILHNSNHTLAVRIDTRGLHSMLANLDDRSKLGSEDTPHVPLQLVIEVGRVTWGNEERPASPRKELIVPIQQGTVNIHFNALCAVDVAVVGLGVVLNEAMWVWVLVEEGVCVVIFSGGLVSRGGRVVWGDGGGKPGVVLKNLFEVVLSQSAIVGSGSVDGGVDLLNSSVSGVLIFGAMPEEVLDGVSLAAVVANVVGAEVGGV